MIQRRQQIKQQEVQTYTGECDDDLTATLAFEPTFTDNCTASGLITVTLVIRCNDSRSTRIECLRARTNMDRK